MRLNCHAVAFPLTQKQASNPYLLLCTMLLLLQTSLLTAQFTSFPPCLCISLALSPFCCASQILLPDQSCSYKCLLLYKLYIFKEVFSVPAISYLSVIGDCEGTNNVITILVKWKYLGSLVLQFLEIQTIFFLCEGMTSVKLPSSLQQ